MSEKHRTGRPLKEHPPGTQVTITLQVPAELKSKLQSHALGANRTLSQEAQRRLERSFSVLALQEDAVALAAAAAHAQFSNRLTDELARAAVEAEQRMAELRRQLAADAAKAEKSLQRLHEELKRIGTNE